jgi:hypothetical protein
MSRILNLKKQIILEANIKLSEIAPVSNKAAVTPAKPTVAPNQYEKEYQQAMATIWPLIRYKIVINGVIAGTNKPSGFVQWVYPAGTSEPKIDLHTKSNKIGDDGKIADQSVLKSYDALFNQKLNSLSEDTAALSELGSKAMSANPNKKLNQKFQTYIMANITDKTLVKDNGEGGPFNDGIFHAVTLKAAIKLKLQNNYSDSSWSITNKRI